MKPRLTQLQSSFASGELDPTLRGQRDLKAYLQGATQARDVQRRSTGGLERRFGTYDLSALQLRARLEAFEFAEDERYVIALEDTKIEIFDVNGVLLQTITGTPFSAAMCAQATTAQLGDVMIICHGAIWPKVLKRTALNTFTLTDVAFETSSNNELVYQPYYKFEDPAITLTPSGSTGAITLTAKNAAGAAYNFFQAGHVGLRFRIYDVEVSIDSLASASVANATVQGTLEGTLDIDPFKTEKGSVVITVTHLFHGLKTGASITYSGCNTCGSIPGTKFDGAHTVTVLDEHRYKITLSGVSYNYTEDKDGDGTPETTAYTSARLSEDGGGPNVKFTVGAMATRRWMEPSISAVRGYPWACTFHEMRLGLGATADQPDGVFLSNSLQPFRFDAGKGYDGDSVQVAVGAEDVSTVVHLVSNGDLQIFTATSESAFQVREGEPITPNNARVKGFSKAASGRVQPAVFDGATLFLQENGLTLFEFTWSDSLGKYLATPISTLASHLIRDPVQIACTPGMTSRAEQLAFIVNGDGTVAVFHSLRAENIAGFVLWSIAGTLVEGVCCVGPDVFFAVNRGGARRLYRLASDDIVSLDGAVWHTNGAEITNWTLDARVRSRTVDIVSEKGYHGQYAVPAGGGIVLPVGVKNVVAGNGFVPVVETVRLNIQLPTGDRAGLIKRKVRSVVDFYQSKCPTIDGVAITATSTDADPTGALSAWDGPFEMYHMGYDRDATTVLSQVAPLGPWQVLSVLEEVAV